MAEKQVVTRPGGTIKWLRTVSTNDSDVTTTVPTGKIWKVYYIMFQLTCTATVGDRRMAIEIGNGTANIFTGALSGNVTAGTVGLSEMYVGGNTTYSASNVKQLLAGGVNNITTITLQALPNEFYLLAGYTIRTYDAAAIDAAADDMIIVMHYTEYEA